MSAPLRGDIDQVLLQRICSEFLEMPGLRLTCQQAQRLLGLDEPTCQTLLDFLVDEKFLCRPDGDFYARTTDVFADRSRLRAARASLDGFIRRNLKAVV